MLRTKYLAGAAALGIVATVVGATPAMAAASKDSKLLSNSRANARFYANGDKVVVCDTKADGYKGLATARYATSDGGKIFIQVSTTKGAGTCRTVSKNIPEGRAVSLALTAVNGTTHTTLIYANGIS
jgi:hypothetical protein